MAHTVPRTSPGTIATKQRWRSRIKSDAMVSSKTLMGAYSVWENDNVKSMVGKYFIELNESHND